MTGYHNADCAFGCPHFDEPTPAGDDQREALIRLARMTADSFDDLNAPLIEGWASGERFTTDDLRALAALAARPSVPTVTTEQREAVARAIHDAQEARATRSGDCEPIPWRNVPETWHEESRVLADAALAALGIEVTP